MAGQLAQRAPSAAVPEHRLVERALRGEAGAFGALYERHLDVVYNYIYFRVRDTTVAEDLTQDVFLRAFRSLGQLRAKRKFEHWLLRIAHNRVLNHWRRRSSRPSDQALPEDEGPVPDALVDVRPLDRLERRLSAEEVLALVARLTDLQQEVIGLRFVAGLSVAETAAVMARSQSAVKNLQHHGLATLRRLLTAENATDPAAPERTSGAPAPGEDDDR